MSEMAKRLQDRFPWLADKRPSWGFECGDGWEKILADFLTVVEDRLPGGNGFTIRQVKEKLGTLRFYYHVEDATEEARQAISDALMLAEGRSNHTCETCGARGRFRSAEGYLFVACDEHAHRDGRVTETLPENFYYVGGRDRTWQRYDPDLDRFVISEAPKFDGEDPRP